MNGVTLHYVTVGSGEPVVLLHGWPQSWFEWRFVMPLMSSNYQLIAPDLRGLGDSSRPLSGYEKKTVASDIYQLLRDHLGIEKFHLVGHDIGGPVAYRIAMDQPQAVNRLVFVDVLIRNDLQKDNSVPARWHHGFNRLVDLPEALTEGREEIFLNWFYRAGGARPDAISPEARTEYVRTYSQPGGMRAAFNHYRVMAQDQRDNIQSFGNAKLTMPVLTLAGGAHSGRKDLMQQSLTRISDNVRSIVVEGAGHWIPEEQPQAVAEHLMAFFNEK